MDILLETYSLWKFVRKHIIRQFEIEVIYSIHWQLPIIKTNKTNMEQCIQTQTKSIYRLLQFTVNKFDCAMMAINSRHLVSIL